MKPIILLLCTVLSLSAAAQSSIYTPGTKGAYGTGGSYVTPATTRQIPSPSQRSSSSSSSSSPSYRSTPSKSYNYSSTPSSGSSSSSDPDESRPVISEKDRIAGIIKKGGYTEASEFFNGLARVKKGDKYGFIDDQGVVAIPLIYDYAMLFNEDPDRALVEKDKHIGCIDRTGAVVVPIVYEGSGQHYSEGLCRFVKGGKIGYVNRVGKVAIPFSYDIASDFRGGYAEVEIGTDKFRIDRRGTRVKAVEASQTSSSAPAPIDRAELSKQQPRREMRDDKWGYVKDGVVVIPFQYDEAQDFDGLALVRVKKNGMYGYINASGVEVVPLEYSYASTSFFEGLAGVEKDGKSGFIDEGGTLVLPLQWNDVGLFSEGLCGVRKEAGGKFGFIDRQGTVIIPYQYDYVIEFFRKGTIKVSLDKQVITIDKTGKNVDE
ncbi:MAG TPA: WG repeat-containing protein [Flavisolibacter sp.]|jgi:hypothetical protein